MNAYHDALELAKCNDSSLVVKIIVEQNDNSYVDIITPLGIHK